MLRNIKVVLVVVGIFFSCSVIFYNSAAADSLPSWIKNTALWYGQGSISETEFLNAIQYLVDNNIIQVKENKTTPENLVANVLIPNGNSKAANTGFYIPLNLEAPTGTTVIWTNDDSVLHTIQSTDEQGKIIGLFNSPPLKTGEIFEFTFDESGVYHYYCSLHPWRVGLVTIG